MLSRTLLGLSLLCLNAGTITAQTFTIEQAMSAPFASDLVASPKAGTVAWTEDTEGRRNLWFGSRNANGVYESKQLTAYADDDGQDVYDITFTPDGASVVFVRGGDSEWPDKTDPNPAVDTKGVSRDVLIVATTGGEPRKLGEGFSPAVSPKGDIVAFLSHGKAYSTGLQPGTTKPQQMFVARGDISTIQWAPDGHALAFVSDRGDHGFIGVYDLASHTITYLEPSTSEDTSPVWSPDGRQIAFIRVPGLPEGSSWNRLTAPAWSLHIADAATGQGHAVWTAADGPGSAFREIHGNSNLLWSSDNHLLFPWEKDGWLHLYSLPTRGGTPTLLTPGDLEVEDIALTRDGHTALFTSNQNDTDRRHLWRVSASGGQPQQITRGEGIEIAPHDVGDELVMMRSDAHSPLRPAILDHHKAIADLAPHIPTSFPGKQFVTPQQVIFPASDGLELHGQLFLPASAPDGKRHPALVFFHGGSRRQMLLGFHSMRYYSNAYAMNQYLASQGYIVLSVNYRSGVGYGLNFREAAHYGRDGASEYFDILGAGHYLQSRSDVDTHRIGVWGGSYGGFMTALALARSSDIFAAGVDMHGVHQWLRPANWKPSHDPEFDARTQKTMWESSPMAYMDTWSSPVLLIQGDDDRNVPFLQTVNLSRELTKHHIEYEELVFPDEIHDFLLHRSWVAAYKAEDDFFRRHLLEKK